MGLFDLGSNCPQWGTPVELPDGYDLDRVVKTGLYTSYLPVNGPASGSFFLQVYGGPINGLSTAAQNCIDISTNIEYVRSYKPGTGWTGWAERSVAVSNGSASREALSAPRTYYVRTDGDDNNDGLANTAGGAFATIDAALFATSLIDCNGYAVTIQLGNAGTYNEDVYVDYTFVGLAQKEGSVSGLSIVGDPANAGNYVLNASGNGIEVVGGGYIGVSGIKVVSGAIGLVAKYGSTIDVLDAIQVGACSTAHFAAYDGGRIVSPNSAALTVNGNSPYNFHTKSGGFVDWPNLAWTWSGTPVVTDVFHVESGCQVQIPGFSTTGSLTGRKYYVIGGSIININGAGTSGMPGPTAGVTGTSGQVI